jgi:hypothetical protein
MSGSINLLQGTREQIVEILDLNQSCHSQLAARFHSNPQDTAGVLSVPEIALRVAAARSALKGTLPKELIAHLGEAALGAIAREAAPEIVGLTEKLFSDLAAHGYGCEAVRAEKLSVPEINHRLEVAVKAMKGEALLLLGGLMVDSYTFNHRTGVSEFSIPAGLSDIDAMKGMNLFFEKVIAIPYWMSFRSAITQDALNWLGGQGEAQSGFEPLPVRDCSKVRRVIIQSLAKGTLEGDRETQERALISNGLVFSHPIDLAIAGGLHACKFHGPSLFVDRDVRCSYQGITLYIDWQGLKVRFNVPDSHKKRLAAAGTSVSVAV